MKLQFTRTQPQGMRSAHAAVVAIWVRAQKAGGGLEIEF
jgi:hypothetical protein